MELGIADLGYSEEGMGDNESMEAPGGGSSAAAASESVSASEELVAEEDGEDMARPTPKPTEKPKTDPTTKPSSIPAPRNRRRHLPRLGGMAIIRRNWLRCVAMRRTARGV